MGQGVKIVVANSPSTTNSDPFPSCDVAGEGSCRQASLADDGGPSSRGLLLEEPRPWRSRASKCSLRGCPGPSVRQAGGQVTVCKHGALVRTRKERFAGAAPPGIRSRLAARGSP